MNNQKLLDGIFDRFVFSKQSTFVVVLLGPLLSILTFLAFNIVEEESKSDFLKIILILDLFYILIVGVLISIKVIKLFINRESTVGGSRLYIRITSVFAILAISPTIIVAVFATISLNFGLEDWFSEKVQRVVGNSLESAQAYELEHRNNLKNDAYWLAKVLDTEKEFKPFLDGGELRKILNRNQPEDLSKAFLINFSGNLKVRGDRSYLFDFKPVNEYDIQITKNEGIRIIEDLKNNEYRALVYLEKFPDKLLYVTRNVDGEVLSLLDQTKETVILYEKIENDRGKLLFEFGLLYLAFSIVLVLSAIWFALWIAERLTKPVSKLVGAVEKVGKGDLDAKVSEEKGQDEIAILGRVFNKMTKEIRKQRDSLLWVNSQTEEKRRLFETVIDGVTGGIIGTDPDGKIEVINTAANKILGLKDGLGLSQKLDNIAPEFSSLFSKAAFLKEGSLEEEIQIVRSDINEKIFLKIAIIRSEKHEVEGYVITFDDLTDLVAAQRSAAWGDVARRVAHEIKNPLTPIKLATERLKKKFALLKDDDKISATEYANMIIRQTESLSRIVTEFSNFSRMPSPKKQQINICELVESAILLQKVAYKTIKFKFKKNFDDVMILGDGQMLNQALLNIIKNSIESILTAKDNRLLNNDDKVGEIKIYIQCQQGEVCISILDNGIGLPKNIKRLFEPYVTIRKEGTGLGLSIVKKIIEDHEGTLILQRSKPFKGLQHSGAEIKIMLPIIKPSNNLHLEKETDSVSKK
mgnify:CR=1 FL=1